MGSRDRYVEVFRVFKGFFRVRLGFRSFLGVLGIRVFRIFLEFLGS